VLRARNFKISRVIGTFAEMDVVGRPRLRLDDVRKLISGTVIGVITGETLAVG
jgi:hypothetical protein